MNLETGKRSKVFSNLLMGKSVTYIRKASRKGMSYTLAFSKDYNPNHLVVMDTLSEIKRQGRKG